VPKSGWAATNQQAAGSLFSRVEKPNQDGHEDGKTLVLLVPEPFMARLFSRPAVAVLPASPLSLARRKIEGLERRRRAVLGAQTQIFMRRNPAGKVPVLQLDGIIHVRKALRSVNTSKEPALNRR